MAERIAVRKRRVRDHVANRDAALDQIQQDNTTKANATMLNAQANMANTQQQMGLTKQRGANRMANTGLRNEGAIDLAGANNQALGARQQNRFGHEDKIGAIEYGRSVEDTKRDHDFKREMFGANREANVQDMETTHQNTMESEAFKMGGELYKTTGNPRLGAQMVSGDFNKLDSFTPAKLGGKSNRYKRVPAELDLNNNPLEGDAGQDRVFDQVTGETRLSSEINRELYPEGSPQDAVAMDEAQPQHEQGQSKYRPGQLLRNKKTGQVMYEVDENGTPQLIAN